MVLPSERQSDRTVILTIRVLEEQLELAQRNLNAAIQEVPPSLDEPQTLSFWQKIKSLGRKAKSTSKSLQVRYTETGQASYANAIYQERKRVVEVTKSCLEGMRAQLGDADMNESMISEVSDLSNPGAKADDPVDVTVAGAVSLANPSPIVNPTNPLDTLPADPSVRPKERNALLLAGTSSLDGDRTSSPRDRHTPVDPAWCIPICPAGHYG